MDQRAEIRDFLRSRRARISPEQVNLAGGGGGHRRVPGLRREEVAMLAGVSVDYYARLERGNLNGVSDEVLGSIARTLQLDEAETAHLFDLARALRTTLSPRRRPTLTQHVRPGLQRLLDGWIGVPAWVRDEHMDVLATNQLGRALYSELFASAEPGRPANNVRFVFLDPRSRDFYPDWDQGANDLVAILRGTAGRHPHDRRLMELIGELSTRSEEFRTKWANHNVRFHRTGVKHLHHPVVGDLELAYEAMELPADPGLTMFAYTAEPASPSEERLKLLASWAATTATEQADATAPAAPAGSAKADRPRDR
jgi:transcriptional regulator with XRE-family HTH domain